MNGENILAIRLDKVCAIITEQGDSSPVVTVGREVAYLALLDGGHAVRLDYEAAKSIAKAVFDLNDDERKRTYPLGTSGTVPGESS